MNTNRVSLICSFASWVIDVAIGFTHPFRRYEQPVGVISTVPGSLLHSENECQQRVNCYTSCKFLNQYIAWIFMHITESLTALIVKITLYHRKITDSRLSDIENCTRCKNILLVVEHVILIRCY
jgi:hypothetical protein